MTLKMVCKVSLSFIFDKQIDIQVSQTDRNKRIHPHMHTSSSVFITFLCQLFYKIYMKTSQIMNKNDIKIKYKYKRWISFFWHLSKVWTQWVQCKVNMRPFAYFALDPLRSYFDECQKNEIYFLNGLKGCSKAVTASEFESCCMPVFPNLIHA